MSEWSRRQFLQAASAAGALASRTSSAATPARGPEDPLGVRPDFPAASDGTYLDSAYICPSPRSVVAAGRAFIEAKATRPIPLGDMLAKTDEVRAQFARLINADPGEIAFLFSTSDGENLVASGLKPAAGDNVVIDELHYNTTFVLYRHLQSTAGLDLRIVPQRDGAVSVEDFAKRVDRRTRLISVALVSHQNGFRHDLRPLADLAHAHGALLYTDAIQAVGMIPVDVKAEGVDFLTCGTYKWLLGGFGTAPFFARKELLDRIPPDRLGHLHVEKDLGNHQYELFKSAKKFEYATLAFGPIYQLGAALAYLDRVGVPRIESHTVALAYQLRRGLVDLGLQVFTPAGNRSAIVSFYPRRPPDEVRQLLERARVKASLREGGRQVRVAPALFNSSGDIQRFLEVATQLARGPASGALRGAGPR